MSNMLTAVHLLSVPLGIDYKHTLYFANSQSQYSYFATRILNAKCTANDCSYQRKDKMIRFPACIDDIINCNYVMYRNDAHSSKWYYAFITRMEYKNDEMTEVYIETDVMQTWLFDYRISPSFIEREHVYDDTTGKHTVPEQLETGDYVINKKNKNASLLTHTLVMACTVDLNDYDDALIGSGKYKAVGGAYYDGIYSGLKYYKMTRDEANKAIKALAETGQSDAIVSIFVVPALYVDGAYPSENPTGYCEVTSGMEVERKPWVNTFGVEDTENYKPTTLDGYHPTNNKLFTYPFCYMLMSNNSGGSAVYKYELFNNAEDETHCPFYIYSALTPSMSICISPRDYNGVEINSLEKLNLGKFPICAWATDVYTNWLTQNAVNIPLSIGTALATTGVAVAGAMLAPVTGGASALATVGAIGAGVSGATSIASTVGEVYQHSLQPPQAEGNINCGDVTFASGTLTFTAYQMTIKAEFAKLIDDYFTMQGYKVNRVGNPLSDHRENFWFTKTIDVNIKGNLPQADLQKIKQCYNNGITFWRNPEYVGNYIVPNAIV